MNPRSSYREAAVQGAAPVGLVVLLYEQVIEDVRRALAAHACGNIEGRTREINHGLLVLGHLEATLDEERGGAVAINLKRFYRQVRAALVEAQCRQSADVMERQIAFLIEMREAWCEVERAERASVIPKPTEPRADSERHSFAEWNA
jgi:flagellar secretion chaperone FliS